MLWRHRRLGSSVHPGSFGGGTDLSVAAQNFSGSFVSAPTTEFGGRRPKASLLKGSIEPFFKEEPGALRPFHSHPSLLMADITS